MSYKDYITKLTLEEARGQNTGVWIAKWLQLYGAVLASGVQLYLTRSPILLPASLIVVLGSVFSGSVLLGPLFVGMYALVFAAIDKPRSELSLTVMKQGFRDPLTSILAGLAWSLLLGGGYALLSLLPLGSVFAYCYLLFLHSFLFLLFPVIAERRLELVPAVNEAVGLAKMHWLPYAVFSFVALVAGLVGVILHWAGTILTAPFYFCLIAQFFRSVRKHDDSTLRENISLKDLKRPPR